LSKAHELLGRVAESSGETASADREFARAISILEQAKLQEPLVGCLATYAAVLEKRGDTEGALAYMKRAVTVTRPDLARPAARADEANRETA
jgi:tetratricopeptide (TPR) repeat protein